MKKFDIKCRILRRVKNKRHNSAGSMIKWKKKIRIYEAFNVHLQRVELSVGLIKTTRTFYYIF